MWVEPDVGDPLGDEPRVLPRRHAQSRLSAGEQEFAGLLAGRLHVVVDRLTGLLGQLESNRTTSFLLSHGRAIDGITVGSHVVDSDGDNVTTAQLAVDGEI